MKAAHGGFTLIEMIIAVAIIGILAAIAYPSYTEHVERGKRTEGQAFLHDVAARQERYFSQNNAYITVNTDAARKSLGLSSVNSPTSQYTITLAKVDGDGGYSLTANQQFNDTNCGNLTLNALGVKGRSGNGKTLEECWR